MIRVEEFLTEQDESPFGKWFDALDSQAAAMAAVQLGRLADGNTPNVKPIGEGVGSIAGRDTASTSAGTAGRS